MNLNRRLLKATRHRGTAQEIKGLLPRLEIGEREEDGARAILAGDQDGRVVVDDFVYCFGEVATQR